MNVCLQYIRKYFFFTVILGISCIPVLSSALTIDEIIEMVKLKVSDKIIIKKIEQDRAPVELTFDQIIQLRKAGVSNDIIEFILNIKSGKRQTAETPVPTVEAKVTAPAGSPAYRVINPDGCVLQISTVPVNAEVYLDDVKVGITPFFSNQLESGWVNLELRKELYEPVKQRIYLKQGMPVEITKTFKPLEPTLIVNVGEAPGSVPQPWFWTVFSGCKSGVYHEAVLRELESSTQGKRIFVYDTQSSQPFSEGATACVEIRLWFQRLKIDPEQSTVKMPKPDVQFYVGNISLSRTKLTEVYLTIHQVPPFDTVEIRLESETGLLWTPTNPLISDLTGKSFIFHKY